MSRAREVVEVMARALAARPDDVRVTEGEHRGQTLVEVFMTRGELGRPGLEAFVRWQHLRVLA